MSSELLAEAVGLTRKFGRKTVVEDVCLALRAGSVTGFVGANGAGKTTTIRLMLGLLAGDGHTIFRGHPLPYWRDPTRIVGAVLGGVAGHPKHRVRAHLRMVAAGAGLPDSRVDEMLALVGMRDAQGKQLRQLSLGMAQRVGIAQALLGDPSVLILDEPANGLDPHSIHWLRTFLRSCAADGRAVFVSSHLLSEMEQLADDVVVLAKGRVVAQAPLSDIKRQAADRSVLTVESPQLDRLSRVVSKLGGALEPTVANSGQVTGLSRFRLGDAAAEHGIALHWLHEKRSSLEDFYLSVAEEEYEIS